MIKKTVLIPSMLDDHFDLLRYAFSSDRYDPVILDIEDNITSVGLTYSNNDLCYPCILIIGQMISALKSGKYDLNNTILMIPQAGDACRASNYICMIRKALIKAGYGNIHVASLNFKGLEKNSQFVVTLGMIKRAVPAIIYGDLLMILKNQVKPYEKNIGDTEKMVLKWIDILKESIICGKKISKKYIFINIEKIVCDFKSIPKRNIKLKKVGIVGELYIKYCHLGNWDAVRYLESQGCEVMVNGFSWYILYYIETHLIDETFFIQCLFRIILKYFGGIQKNMVDILHSHGFECIDDYYNFKKNGEKICPFKLRVADGWLISCEMCNLIKSGYNRVLCAQPFGCMANHVCGKGIYPFIQHNFKDARIVSVDYDSSGSKVNIRNRIRLLIDFDL